MALFGLLPRAVVRNAAICTADYLLLVALCLLELSRVVVDIMALY